MLMKSYIGLYLLPLQYFTFLFRLFHIQRLSLYSVIPYSFQLFCFVPCVIINLLFTSFGFTLLFHIASLWYCLPFLARDSIYAIARYMPSPVRPSVRLSVCLSVCPSVTRVDQSKTFEVRITQPSPQSSPMTLVS